MNNNGNQQTMVQDIWNYAHVLRDQAISYGDHIEQITYLLFLKMDQEGEDLLGETSAILPQWSRAHLVSKDGDELELQYRHTLEALAREDGLIGTICSFSMTRGRGLDNFGCGWHGRLMRAPVKLPEILEAEQTPWVKELLKLVEELAQSGAQLEEENGRLNDESAVLMGQKQRPVFKSSKMDEQAGK